MNSVTRNVSGGPRVRSGRRLGAMIVFVRLEKAHLVFYFFFRVVLFCREIRSLGLCNTLLQLVPIGSTVKDMDENNINKIGSE